MLFGAALFMDSNGYLGEANTEASQAGTFLGTGVKVEKSSCIDDPGGYDYRVITKSVTIFGIQVGKSWPAGRESC